MSSNTLHEWLQVLPLHLLERCELAATRNAICDRSTFVLYWMRTAMRVDENPALDSARLLAAERGLPLLVYGGLSQRYPYASDRHHTFVLQGVQDLQPRFEALGIRYAFHLERSGHDQDALRQLADQASLVITEDMPCDAPSLFLRALRRVTRTPIVQVDTACVVPMRLVGQAHDRAFKYRSATRKLYAERTTRGWPEIDVQLPESANIALPFEPLDFSERSLSEWVAACDIDHSVPPVLDTQGGSADGYARWQRFRSEGLRSYAKLRNDPLAGGVSRMSAYLHYGMVSPMRLARETAAQANAGAEKYLDELLIWRELAYGFCKYRPDHARWTALPCWARDTLQQHQADPREHTYSWEELARGATHDSLWNAAQKSLLIHGELHNNVRMTWGKALLQWREDPREALKLLIDLNHRFALDGRDPASYGGILWCLGQFDRPFQPAQPILGTVRGRPTSFHARRLDVVRYAARTSQRRKGPPPRIAVVGAGLSGAMAARILADHGCEVTVWEKSRGAGGRMATRVMESGSFDHGAQYFTVHDANFQRYVDAWNEQNLVKQWQGAVVVFDRPAVATAAKPTRRYVVQPAMNALAKHLLAGQQLRTECPVDVVRPRSGELQLEGPEGQDYGRFERVVVTAPAPQTASILREFPELARQAAAVSMRPCWAVMLELQRPVPSEWSAAFVNVGPLRWIALDSSKPGRDCRSQRFVLHASPEWSEQYLESDPDEVSGTLCEEFFHVSGFEPQQTRTLQAHRWRYSIPEQVALQRALCNEQATVLAGGDWAGGPRVEGAFLSGCALAGRILGALPAESTEQVRQMSLFPEA